MKNSELAGNIDVRKIRDISKQYGQPEVIESCDAMRDIKIKRNSLAHGNDTFAEVGREYSVEDLIRMKVDVEKFLSSFLSNVKLFIDNDGFLK